MNIYDCFMYYDEDLLLDIRLNSLEKFVKKFVITEATYTHNGENKKLNFDINKFKRFKDKIIYIVVDKQPKNILELKKEDTKEKTGEKLIGLVRWWDEYTARNNQALEELVNVHGVEVRKLPDEVIEELRKLSAEAVSDLTADNDFAQRVAQSVEAFKRQAKAYHGISEEAFYKARQQ